jgi:organic radical activating enzyme
VEKKQQHFPSVNKVLPMEIPQNFELMIRKWSYPENRIGEFVVINGEKVKKMLTLDINIPEEGFASSINKLLKEEVSITTINRKFRGTYPCIHKCPGCFNEATVENPILTTVEVLNIIKQAKELGLESIKFLGPGELLMHKNIFYLLDELQKLDIVVGIFTKGAIMGNDELSQYFHGINSLEFTSRVYSYDNVNFYVGARSFNEEDENHFIPQNKKVFPSKFNYHESRNLCIERLCKLGANKDLFNQRIAIVCSPITTENISYAYDAYLWSVERNIPIYLPPTMVSGKGHKLEASASEKKFEDDYIDMAVKVYQYALKRGIYTKEKLLREGVHPYIGIAPCNQLTHGMYIHYDGQVWRCPGNDTLDFRIFSDVRKDSLIRIWKNSSNYTVNEFNNGCVKDGFSLPYRFYSEVLNKLI